MKIITDIFYYLICRSLIFISMILTAFRQVSEHYKVMGRKATQLDTSTQFYNRALNPLSKIIKQGGHCIHFGWNSNAMGKNRGFEIIEILLIAHGGHHNDTIVTVERKLNDRQRR